MPRTATPDDAPLIAQMLKDFNAEFDDPSPPLDVLSARVAELMGIDTAVALADDDAGVALMRFRPNLWSEALEVYLAEFYIVPDRRGAGLGRALLTYAMDLARERGADHIDLGTGEDDVVARKLYSSMGFTRLEGENGPLMYVYEREL
jgi:GNAT superfamily N-acetyltransferase